VDSDVAKAGELQDSLIEIRNAAVVMRPGIPPRHFEGASRNRNPGGCAGPVSPTEM
jgi:hypothetical protein